MSVKLTMKLILALGAMTAMACGGACGDGEVATNEAGDTEACDDGNATPGDGCNANCTQIEPGFECPTAGAACVAIELCGNGAIDAGEDCDGADLGGANCTNAFLASGNLACKADCTFDTSGCAAAAGDGIRTPESLLAGQGEECDDANLVDGDGCSAAMTLEALSTITVNAAQAQLNNTDASAAKFSVFSPLINAFDADADGTADTSLLLVITTDRSDICDIGFEAGGFNGFQTALFVDGIQGTVAISGISQPGANGDFITGAFTGTAPLISDPAATGVEAGYIIFDGAAFTSDTTFGGDGIGTANLTINTTDIDLGLVDAAGNPVLIPAGNLTLDYANLNQITQFQPAQVTIAQPISGTIKATSCTIDFQ